MLYDIIYYDITSIKKVLAERSQAPLELQRIGVSGPAHYHREGPPHYKLVCSYLALYICMCVYIYIYIYVSILPNKAR